MELQNTIIVRLDVTWFPWRDYFLVGRALPGTILCLKSQGGPASDSAYVPRVSTEPAQVPALPAAPLHCSLLDFVTATKQNHWEGLWIFAKAPLPRSGVSVVQSRHCAGVPGGHSYPLFISTELSLHIPVLLLQQVFPNWLLQMVPWACSK